MKRTAMLLTLLFSACMQPSSPGGDGPSGDNPPVVSPWGRELGTLSAIYPIPNPDGSYSLEFRMTRDTVVVDLDSLRAFASDSLGKAVIRSTMEPFYTLNERCFYTPKKDACLEFH